MNQPENMKTSPVTLVILAAGMGSRYGGLKQMDTFTEEGDTITDLAIYDAIFAGFTKVVFVIRKALESDFKSVFSERWGDKIEIDFVFQEIDAIPITAAISKRTKPWGTGHAVLVAKDHVQENFALINADDFYGREAFIEMAKQLQHTDPDRADFCMVSFPLENTLSENGSVSRGQCFVDEQGFLKQIIERTKIQYFNGVLKANDEDGTWFSIEPNTPVSMNFWGFTPKVFDLLEGLFADFIQHNQHSEIAEFFLPAAISQLLQNQQVTVQVLTTDSNWFGVTYPEDKHSVQKEINHLKTTGVYPKRLWQNE